jgi:methyl-accepting chemotaxis protein
VAAAEQGVKAVQSGVEESFLAGQSIEQLSHSVSTSAKAVGTIDAASAQQVLEVDRVGTALVNIEQAMHQNLDGISQLEAAARRLEELETELKSLVQMYRV